MGCDVVKCPSCGIVYAKRRLNENGLSKYWSDYLSRVHVHDPETVEKRNQMYQIDYAFSSQFVRSWEGSGCRLWEWFLHERSMNSMVMMSLV